MPRTKGSKKGVKRYPAYYHIRISKKTLEKLKKIGSKKVRESLEEM
jgi:hypothetical protein